MNFSNQSPTTKCLYMHNCCSRSLKKKKDYIHSFNKQTNQQEQDSVFIIHLYSLYINIIWFIICLILLTYFYFLPFFLCFLIYHNNTIYFSHLFHICLVSLSLCNQNKKSNVSMSWIDLSLFFPSMLFICLFGDSFSLFISIVQNNCNNNNYK